MTTQATTQTKLAPIHDFGAKLLQPSMIGRLKEYVVWQARRRGTLPPDPESAPDYLETGPDHAPVSINLDLTTACNYACDHCVDMDILNMPFKHDFDELLSALDRMIDRGMRSVILIGGGEPTRHPKFTDTVRFLKGRDVQVAVVSNGSGNAKILDVADLLGERDWVRLSLDSGSDATFQAMHKPKKQITLDEICEGIPPIKEKNPGFKIGFSFIITWKGAEANDEKIVENIHEIVEATERARRYRFDYISMKPFLIRAEANNAEIVGDGQAETGFASILPRIRASIDEAKKLETDTFKVVESTNLRVLEEGTAESFTRQPKNCHMQFFRQVLSPLGIYNCPVYRHVPHAQIGPKNGYADPARHDATRRKLADLIENFNATDECKEVTCLYNPVNWWIEALVTDPTRLDALLPAEERADYYF